MMKPEMSHLIMFMLAILIMNMFTTKTSIMCINLVLYTMTMSMIMSMKMKLTPIPFIVFLTMIGGLMIIFLYLAATLWKKKEMLTLKNKMIYLMMMIMPSWPTIFISQHNINNMINMFNKPLNKITMLLIMILTIMLVFTIEIHMKMNSPFRQKLKIWE